MNNIYKGVAAGVAAGLAGALVMNQFQAFVGKLMENDEGSHGAQSLQEGTPQHGIGRELAERGVDAPDDDAAVRTGNAVSELIFDHHLTKSEKESAGTAVHYAMGLTSGAIYGAVAEIMPSATACEGTAFGAAIWLIADEGVVPGLGLSKNPSAFPISTHTYSIASHLVYGLTTEFVRRALRRAM